MLDPYRVGKYPNFVEEPARPQFFDDQTWARLRQIKGLRPGRPVPRQPPHPAGGRRGGAAGRLTGWPLTER